MQQLYQLIARYKNKRHISPRPYLFKIQKNKNFFHCGVALRSAGVPIFLYRDAFFFIYSPSCAVEKLKRANGAIRERGEIFGKAAHNLTIRVLLIQAAAKHPLSSKLFPKMAVEVLEMPTCARYNSVRYPYCTNLTELEVTAIDGSNEALSLMFRDDLCNNMRPWWYYCEKDDPTFFEGRSFDECVDEEVNRILAGAEETAVAAVTAPKPVEITLDKSSAAQREAECRAWLAVPRNKRKPFSMGGLVVGANCFNKEDSIVIKGLPADAPTLYGDLREFLGEVAVIIDLYKPAKGPLFLGLLDGKSKKAVIDAFPAGILYKGSVLTLELAMNRSKTSAEMAAGKSV